MDNRLTPHKSSASTYKFSIGDTVKVNAPNMFYQGWTGVVVSIKADRYIIYNVQFKNSVMRFDESELCSFDTSLLDWLSTRD